jgi:solute carrier family 6 amino acid transporter-like protein 5/7/9/14
LVRARHFAKYESVSIFKPFSLGNLAHELGVEVDQVVKSGTGLAFISYPSAIGKFEWMPQLFSVLFFLMLITLGLGE